jgi:hypothetical protein
MSDTRVILSLSSSSTKAIATVLLTMSDLRRYHQGRIILKSTKEAEECCVYQARPVQRRSTPVPHSEMALLLVRIVLPIRIKVTHHAFEVQKEFLPQHFLYQNPESRLLDGI